jgi:signal recognition particle subunit SRP54
VLKSLTPGQQVVKVVHDELVALLGGTVQRPTMAPHSPTVVMVMGLQGSGKTTTVSKLGRWFAKEGYRPLLVAADVYRPAAIYQLEALGKQLGLPVFAGDRKTPVRIALEARELAESNAQSPVILDTAGRLHIDEEMVAELKALKARVQPHQVLLVTDAMMGQDAVTMAERFNRDVGVDGIILTKLDGDARGGAALSLREVTGRPILFTGTGEKLDALEPFHPDRMASRILGMGDVLTLVEKVQQAVDQEKAQELARKIREDTFTLEDFAEQLCQVRSMGPLDQLVEMIPFFKGAKGQDLAPEERELKRFQAIISSMTPEERRRPEIIGGSRRIRVAKGSGTSVQDVNRLLKQFTQVRKLTKNLSKLQGKAGKLHRAFPFTMR